MRIARPLRLVLLPIGVALALAGLSGCASGPTTGIYAHRHRPPPGPAGDPWGPYIREAANRFRIPEKWIRAVMRQESGGQADLVSSAGAIGLMQVMPRTYAELAGRYGLGSDPYDPHDNMIAGVGYLRQMYDRYGAPNFLAAYNAGPGRVDSYLSGASDLPYETVNYVASISPSLRGESVAFTPPPPVDALASTPLAPVTNPPGSRLASRTLINAPPCDADAAYDPTRACRDIPSPVVPANAPPCDPDAAYDPQRLCRNVPPPTDPLPVSVSLPPPQQVAAAPIRPGAPLAGNWAIEMGVFPQSDLARNVATAARGSLPDLLNAARVALPPTAPFGGVVLYRARLTALSAPAARDACGRLTQRGMNCVVVSPDRAS
jgi:hypothetical protein